MRPGGPGDIVKALAFGADFVMVGGMFAGTRPTPGAPILDEKSGSSYKVYRGMASKEVADDHLGGLTGWKTAEGVATRVPYREDEEEILADIVGGLRSGLTYAGANTVRELQRKLNYVLVSPAGRIESLPHKTLG
jgi:IMP dehydrogenase